MPKELGEVSEDDFNEFLQRACLLTKQVLLSEAAQLISTFTNVDYNVILKQLPKQRLIMVDQLYSNMVSILHHIARKESAPSPRPSLPVGTLLSRTSLSATATMATANSSITSQQPTARPSDSSRASEGSPEVRLSTVERWTSLRGHRLRGRQATESGRGAARSPSPVPPPARSSSSTTYGLSPQSSEGSKRWKVCRQFREKGMCSFGSRCLYHHMDGNGRTRPNSSLGTLTSVSPLSDEAAAASDDGREEVHVHMPLISATIASDLLYPENKAKVLPRKTRPTSATATRCKQAKSSLGIMGRTEHVVPTARISENKENERERLPSQRRALAALPVNCNNQSNGPLPNGGRAKKVDAAPVQSITETSSQDNAALFSASRLQEFCNLGQTSKDTSESPNASTVQNLSCHDLLPQEQQMLLREAPPRTLLCPYANMMLCPSSWFPYGLPAQTHPFGPLPPAPTNFFTPLQNEYAAAAASLLYHMAEYQTPESLHQ